MAAVVGGALIFYTINAQYPLRQWLLFRVLGYWLLTLYWGAGCLAVGLSIVLRVAPRQYRLSDAVFIGFALGVLAFAIAVFSVGLAGRLGTPFFVLAPLFFVVLGFPSLALVVRGRHALNPFRGLRPSWVDIGAIAIAFSGLLAVYLPLLTPHNIQHDARWYHLPIAQQYVSQGGIARFPEGWLFAAYPHLSSLLYTWAFLLPARVVHRIELVQHMEFLVFLVTVASIPALVRKLSPGTRLPLASAGFFLFPGFLVYDSNLAAGADHIAAVFAPAGMLALYPALRTLSPRHCALVGAAAAGAALTKYSAVSVAAPLLAFVVVRAVAYAVRREHYRRPAEAVFALLGTFALLWSPHWLKNLLWYGDPLYPLLSDHLSLRPWDAQAASYFRIFQEWAVLRPSQDLAGVIESVWAGLTLGFRVHEYGFHGDVPTFGFLFATTLFCLPFVRVSPRAWVAYGLGVSAGTVWYFINHHDRYLQACLPWLVAATLSVLFEMWTSMGKIGRFSAGALVSAQLVAGAGVSLLPTYLMVPGGHPIDSVMALVNAGYEKHYAGRFAPYEEWNFSAWTDLGKELPKGARVLVHEDRLWLGLDKPVVVDEMQWQAGIRYGDVTTAAAVFDVLRPFHVSHIVTGTAHGDGGDHGIAGNLAFWEFVASYATRIDGRGKLTLWKMPSEKPAAVPMGPALVLTCNQNLPGGFYEFLAIRERQPSAEVAPKQPVPDALLDRAAFLVLEEACDYTVPPAQLANFRPLTNRGRVEFWKRAGGAAE